jgi:hypothetical protein
MDIHQIWYGDYATGNHGLQMQELLPFNLFSNSHHNIEKQWDGPLHLMITLFLIVILIKITKYSLHL